MLLCWDKVFNVPQGIVDLSGEIELEEESVLYRCPRTGAVVTYFRVKMDRGVSWEAAMHLLAQQPDDGSGFFQAEYRSASGEGEFVLALRKREVCAVAACQKKVKYFHLVRPNTGYHPAETYM